MKQPVSDLFPETLIVTTIGGQPMTTSVAIAEHFGKKHKNVLRIIKALIERTSQADRRLNFEPTIRMIAGPKGALRKEAMYLVSEKGFQFVVSGFTGAEADEWKWQFLDAFENQRRQLNVMRDRYVGAIDILCPPLRPAVERTQLGQDRVSIASVIGKSCASVTYYRAKARRLGLLGDRT